LNCGKKPATSVDHVIPLVSGGENKLQNTQLLCVECNKKKGDSATDYRDGNICPNEFVANKKEQERRKPHRWKPGQSGNPRGRPSQGLSWKELIVAEGDKYDDNLGMTRKEYLVICAFDHAENGNAQILKELFQRSEPIADLVDVTVDDKRNLTPEERRERLAGLLERARERRTGLVA
jgi:hypothetical protein